MERFQNLGVFLWIATCVLNLLGLFIIRIFGTDQDQQTEHV